MRVHSGQFNKLAGSHDEVDSDVKPLPEYRLYVDIKDGRRGIDARTDRVPVSLNYP